MKFYACLVMRDPTGDPLFEDHPDGRVIVRLSDWLERQVRSAPAGADVGQVGVMLSLHRKLRMANGPIVNGEGPVVELDTAEEKALQDLIATFTRAPWWLVSCLYYLLWPDQMKPEEREYVNSWYIEAARRNLDETGTETGTN